jgi:septal ring factor EnvC (AmiA/AmiB activator)
MFGNKITIAIFLMLFTSLGTVLTIGYFYYKNNQATILQLQENAAKLASAVKQQDDTIKSLRENSQIANKVITELNDTLSESRVRNRELQNRLAKHDIGMLAIERPEMIERIINNASNNALRCFELLSGAPLTEKEKNAKNEKEFNSECPHLFNTYRRIP